MKRIVVLWCILSGGIGVFAQQVPLTSSDSIAVKQLFFAGLRDKLNEDYNRGILNFGKAAAIDPGNAAAWYEIALLNYRMSKFTEAEAAIKKAITVDGNNIWYLKLLAEFYKRNGNMTALVAVFDRLIALSPEEQSFYFDKSNAFLIQGKKMEALAGYDAIEKKFGDVEGLAEARERATGVAAPAGSSKIDKENDPVLRAKAFLAKNDFKSAAHELESVAATFEDDPLFLALYGDVLFEAGDLAKSLSYYKKALKLTDQLYVVWEKSLNIQILMGQYKEMIEMGEAALSVYPNQAILYYYMAFSLHREAKNTEALSYIKNSLQLDGENRSLQALIFALQAEILIDENKLPEADLAFNKAVEADPENYLIINNYAYYLALRGRQLAKAESLIAVAAEAMPADESVADTYAFVLFKRGKYTLARTWIEKAIKNNEADNSVYFEHYGDILFFLGEQEKAVSQWQRSKETGNDSALLNQKINEKKYIK